MKNNEGNEKARAPLPLVAIFESRPMFRKGVANVLAEYWPNAALIEAKELADLPGPGKTGAPDLIFVGLESRVGKKALQDIPQLLSQFPNSKLVIYDYQSDIRAIPWLLRLGIHGYLPADFDTAELKLCLAALAEGKKYINNEIVWEYLRYESNTGPRDTVKLSKMEEVVADYLTKGISVSQIAKTMNRQLSTISTVKAKIFKKMRVENILDLKEKLHSEFNVS